VRIPRVCSQTVLPPFGPGASSETRISTCRSGAGSSGSKIARRHASGAHQRRPNASRQRRPAPVGQKRQHADGVAQVVQRRRVGDAADQGDTIGRGAHGRRGAGGAQLVIEQPADLTAQEAGEPVRMFGPAVARHLDARGRPFGAVNGARHLGRDLRRSGGVPGQGAEVPEDHVKEKRIAAARLEKRPAPARRWRGRRPVRRIHGTSSRF
jgi:hypothetical protein